MTAEVIIMNKRGVAMAADSACTRSSSDGRPVKIFNSAKKLFNLSQKCPIGAVTYSNASFNGIPWDLLFQDFYSRHTESWTTVEECVEAFIIYLQTTPLSGDEDTFFKSVVWEMQQRYAPSLSEEVNELIIDLDNTSLKHADSRLDFDEEFCQQVVADYKDKVRKYVDNIIFLRRDIKDEIKDKVKENILLALYKQATFLDERSSGIAICGYGTTEFFPACQRLAVKGTLNGRLVYDNLGYSKIDNNDDGRIIPLAQRDVMDGFISGIQNDVKSRIHKSMRSLIRSIRRNTMNRIRQLPNADQIPLDQIEEIIQDQILIAEQRIEPQISNSHLHITRGMINIVSDLNIPDLGKIAKNLISMTSFRREVSDDWETVGGPVDVAVISKVDGFVWIERKDIYDNDLNIHTNNSFSMREE